MNAKAFDIKGRFPGLETMRRIDPERTISRKEEAALKRAFEAFDIKCDGNKCLERRACDHAVMFLHTHVASACSQAHMGTLPHLNMQWELDYRAV